MTCVNSFTTKTGTFTAYPELVTGCEAEKLCKEKGQMVAPFTNEEDMRAASDMFNGNNCWLDDDSGQTCDANPALESCQFSSNEPTLYRIGLNFKRQGDGSFRKIFPNGIPWSDKLHEGLYDINPEQKRQCPLAYFAPDPDFEKGISFGIGEEDEDCKWEEKMGYICMKPAAAGQARPQPIVQDRVSPVVSRETPWVVACCAAVLTAAVLACCVVFYHRKSKRCEEKINELEEKVKYDCIYRGEQV